MKETAKPQNTIEPPEKTPFFKKEGESGKSVMRSPVPFFTANGIQAKLTVGQPGDKFEQQANRVADKVVNGRNVAINRKSDGDHTQLLEESGLHMQEEEELQMQEEEEELQMQEEEEIQMQEEEEELQMQEEEEELQMQEEEELQMQAEEEELQMHEEEEELQMQEEEEELQMKSGNGKPVMSDGLSQQITSAAGKGSPLPASTQSEMSESIGYDFSDVKIHTGPESVQMNRDLGAQAFTHGNDVFFNAGKFNPESTNGKHLLAHELTHVVQQGKGRVAPQVQGIFGKIKKGLKKVGKAIKGGAKKVFGGIKKGVKSIGKGAKWLFGKIKKGASIVGKGIKKVAGKIWKGLKKAGKWVWNGLKYVGRQLWDKIKAIYYRVKRWITSLPARLKRLVVHLWNGVKSLKPWSLDWWKSLGKADTWKNFGSWLGELAIYALEVGGIGEIYETIADFIKFNTRAMTDDEIKLAKTVFGNSINYNLIRIDEYAVLGPKFSGREYVSFHTINGWGKIDPETLIHELTHVWQYEKMGAMYMPRALHGNSKPGFYDYGGVQPLIDNAGKGMDAFNPEQQGDIMEDYYRILNNIAPKHGSGTAADLIHYEVYVNEVKSK